MQKIYFLFMALLCCFSGYSANCVSTTQVSANYSTQQVTFKLTWTGCNGTTHLNKVWCYVDFQPVDAAGNKGTCQRATISGTPSVVNGTYAAGNTTGFWITGTNGQSATVTVKLGNASGKFNWCVTATDYPPNVILDQGSYTFKGTTNFIVSPLQLVTSKKVARANITISAGTTFTDATGCPGIGNLYCPYAGTDLYMDFTHLCQQRTVGAKNWEAWIKDSRDNQLYHIAQFSDGTWWFMDDLATAVNRAGLCDGVSSYYGNQVACPTNWRLPTFSELTNGAILNGQYMPAAAYTGCSCIGTSWNCNGYVNNIDYCMSGCNNAFCFVRGGNVCNCWNGQNEAMSCNGQSQVGRVRCVRKF